MKDKTIQIEKNEVSHILGGPGRYYVVVIHTYVHQSHVCRHTMTGWVVITDVSVYIRERGGGGRGGYGLRSVICDCVYFPFYFKI